LHSEPFELYARVYTLYFVSSK